MKNFGRKIIILIFVAVMLVILNPNLRKHQDKIIEKYKQENPVISLIPADELVRKLIAYKNYYFFSVSKISVTNETVSFGIAGFVIVYGSLDLMKYKDKVQEIVN
jgi:hypothetical protein